MPFFFFSFSPFFLIFVNFFQNFFFLFSFFSGTILPHAPRQTCPRGGATIRALVVGVSRGFREKTVLSGVPGDIDLVVSLLSPVTDQITVLREPTMAEFLRSCAALSQGMGRGDTAVLFFAGHGRKVSGRGGLVMADGTVDGPTLRASLFPPSPFHHTIAVILDSCYTEDLLALPWVHPGSGSGGPILQQAKRPRDTPFAPDLPDGTGGGIVCLSAASVSEKAYEARGGSGLLTSSLAKAVRSSAGSQQTWLELLSVIRREIPRDTPQIPTPVLTATSKVTFTMTLPFQRDRAARPWWHWLCPIPCFPSNF